MAPHLATISIANYMFSMELTLKGNKKSKPIVFERGGLREEAKIKGGKVTVGDGLSADSGTFFTNYTHNHSLNLHHHSLQYLTYEHLRHYPSTNSRKKSFPAIQVSVRVYWIRNLGENIVSYCIIRKRSRSRCYQQLQSACIQCW
jgi:hypothetical protein